jgi:hypothetical protein
MTMNQTRSTPVPAKDVRFGHVALNPVTHAELRWFFNDAESEVDMPSSFGAIAGAGSPTSGEAVERRAEAVHAAGKISQWLKAIPVGHALLLQGLFTEREWPSPVARALGHLAGAVEASPSVRALHLHARISGKTCTTSVGAWLREVIEQGGPDAVADWLREAEVASALATRAYEKVRGEGRCVIPGEDA